MYHTAITLPICIAKVIAVNFTEIFRNICSVIDNHIEFSSLPFDIIEELKIPIIEIIGIFYRRYYTYLQWKQTVK